MRLKSYKRFFFNKIIKTIQTKKQYEVLKKIKQIPNTYLLVSVLSCNMFYAPDRCPWLRKFCRPEKKTVSAPSSWSSLRLLWRPLGVCWTDWSTVCWRKWRHARLTNMFLTLFETDRMEIKSGFFRISLRDKLKTIAEIYFIVFIF